MPPSRMLRTRLLPVAVAGSLVAGLTQLEHLAREALPHLTAAVRTAAVAQPAPATAAVAPALPAPQDGTEQELLQALRTRRAEVEAREQAIAAREMVLAAAERRLSQRVEELAALQQRLETLERERAAREEAGLRSLVRVYEGMRPRDAAAILDDLELPVLVQIMDRMRAVKAAPVLGAMRPERARLLTAELARLRAERLEDR